MAAKAGKVRASVRPRTTAGLWRAVMHDAEHGVSAMRVGAVSGLDSEAVVSFFKARSIVP